jgi:ABC-type sugar transport system ATPase subunit
MIEIDGNPGGEPWICWVKEQSALAEVELRQLAKCYAGDLTALSALDLTIPAGELLVILGPSGSGKTTLLRLIAGLEAPSSGGVWIEGREVTGVPPHRRDVAMVFQHPALYPHLRVLDNLAFGLRARGLPRNQVLARVNLVAGMLGLDHLLRRYPSALSGGERQRVAIGRAVVRQPRVLLLDEPFSSLDSPLRAALREDVVELHRRLGTTLVHVTHDQAEALVMGDRIAILDRGRLLQCGTPRMIYECPANRFVASFVGSPPMNIIPCQVQRQGETIRIQPVDADRSLCWTIPIGSLPPDWPATIHEIELGLRPEAISVQDKLEAAESQPTLSAQIRRLDFNGPELLATLAVGPYQLVARLPAGAAIHEKQQVLLSLDLGRATWFEPMSGRAMNPNGREEDG